MTDSRQTESQGKQDVPTELRDLASTIAQCSALTPQVKGPLCRSLNRVIDMVIRRRRILDLVQEALAQLRLDVKYLMFDLEVTRRERDEFKARIDELEREREF
ncbi:MAG: transcriptional regulator [Planctomycetaceae bacterium]